MVEGELWVEICPACDAEIGGKVIGGESPIKERPTKGQTCLFCGKAQTMWVQARHPAASAPASPPASLEQRPSLMVAFTPKACCRAAVADGHPVYGPWDEALCLACAQELGRGIEARCFELLWYIKTFVIQVP